MASEKEDALQSNMDIKNKDFVQFGIKLANN
jgi:hypothetical protein